ncbi:MAG: hypothetical protein HYT48_00890 [Candidatus Vogelbacteria bacterium]|nr:hypothetical protein [Candidatus Vogelbacteria bacterium]
MNTSKSVIVWVIVLILVIIGLAWWLVRYSNPAANNLAAVGQFDATSTAGVAPKIEMDDQFPGDVVFISSVTLPQTGFVVIHKDDAGQPGYVVGAEYFDAKTGIGAVSLSEPTRDGETYFAVLHADTNNDKNFSLKTDLPLRDASGQLIMTQFEITKNLPERKG